MFKKSIKNYFGLFAFSFLVLGITAYIISFGSLPGDPKTERNLSSQSHTKIHE